MRSLIMKPILCSLTFALVIVAGCHTAFACTCSLERLDDVKKLVQEPNRFFFVGEVKKVVEYKIHVQPDNRAVVTARHVTFQIHKSWNKRWQRTIKIVTGGGHGDCGFRFTVKETYFVDAWHHNKEYSTNICTLTNTVAKSQFEIAELDKWQMIRRTAKRRPSAFNK